MQEESKNIDFGRFPKSEELPLSKKLFSRQAFTFAKDLAWATSHDEYSRHDKQPEPAQLKIFRNETENAISYSKDNTSCVYDKNKGTFWCSQSIRSLTKAESDPASRFRALECQYEQQEGVPVEKPINIGN